MFIDALLNVPDPRQWHLRRLPFQHKQMATITGIPSDVPW
jgi:hypothetical protein